MFLRPLRAPRLCRQFILSVPINPRALRLLPLDPPHRLSSTCPSAAIPSSSTSTPPTLIIPDGSPHHSTLTTFLAHASRTSLSPASTVYIGTHYEYTVQAALRRLGFNLTRVGRSCDRGIDLLGTWKLPVPDSSTTTTSTRPNAHSTRSRTSSGSNISNSRSTSCSDPPPPSPPPPPLLNSPPPQLRILVQCKSHSRPLRPEHVRELEGAFAGAPAGWRVSSSLASRSSSPSGGARPSSPPPARNGPVTSSASSPTTTTTTPPVVGFLVNRRPASRGVRDAVARSRYPIGFLVVDVDGVVRQMVWNWRAGEVGLGGVGVEVWRGGGEVGGEEIVLTWGGGIVDGTREGVGVDGHVRTQAVVSAVLDGEDLVGEMGQKDKKKRGRPRKVSTAVDAREDKPKRKRGRPKKFVDANGAAAVLDVN